MQDPTVIGCEVDKMILLFVLIGKQSRMLMGLYGISSHPECLQLSRVPSVVQSAYSYREYLRLS